MGLTGNCGACIKHFAGRRPKTDTPCHRCPKYLLHPPGYGLMAKNALAIHLYRLASRDQRAGMDATLIGTLTTEAAVQIIDEHAEHFPTAHSRQTMLQKLYILDRIVTRARGESESIYREVKADEAKWKSERRKNKRI